MRYDLEYLEAGQTHSFAEDLKLLFREAEGSTKSFKPVLFEGRHLECRGCVNGWEESTVLVLTVREIPIGRTKSALIRSLRTQVNAVINLCQDLQTSADMGDQDKADVEVLAMPLPSYCP